MKMKKKYSNVNVCEILTEQLTVCKAISTENNFGQGLSTYHGKEARLLQLFSLKYIEITTFWGFFSKNVCSGFSQL